MRSTGWSRRSRSIGRSNSPRSGSNILQFERRMFLGTSGGWAYRRRTRRPAPSWSRRRCDDPRRPAVGNRARTDAPLGVALVLQWDLRWREPDLDHRSYERVSRLSPNGDAGPIGWMGSLIITRRLARRRWLGGPLPTAVPLTAEPMVRIHLAPAASQANSFVQPVWSIWSCRQCARRCRQVSRLGMPLHPTRRSARVKSTYSQLSAKAVCPGTSSTVIRSKTNDTSSSSSCPGFPADAVKST